MALKLCYHLVFLSSLIGFLSAGDADNTLSAKKPPLFDYGEDLDKVGFDIDPIVLDDSISYFGGSYKNIYISLDGTIGFESKTGFKSIDFAEGVRNEKGDKPFMAPFLHKGYAITESNDVDERDYQGKIYYRTLYRKKESDLETFEYLDEFLKEAVINVPADFQVKTLIVVTWEDVTDNSAIPVQGSTCSKERSSQCKGATFQAVIAASEKHTYVIFNYEMMDIPYKNYYQVGFNGGHGRGWFNVIPCHGECSTNLNVSSRINELPKLTGSDQMGRYVLDVGGERIVRGGCLPTEIDAGMMESYPTTVGMLGGEMLQVSGKCLTASKAIYCKFGADEDSPITKGMMINSMKGYCPVPILITREPVLVKWSHDKENWGARRSIEVVLPQQQNLNSQVKLEYRKQWYSKDAKTITVEWTPSSFSTNSQAKVDVRLLGYRENDNEKKVEIKEIAKLGQAINRAGKLEIDVETHRCKEESECLKYDVSLLEVALQSDYHGVATDRVAIRYGPIPLGWYANEELSSSMGSDWSDQQCERWHEEDKEDTDWLKDLTACPCNLRQAQADFGSFQPSFAWHNFMPGTDMHIQSQSTQCFISVAPTSKGAGNKCCYDKDGRLLYSQLSFDGSMPERSHLYGASDFHEPGLVPELSHWLRDVIPFYKCCFWSENRQCDLYTELRPTQDCRNYQPPGIGMVRGTSHISTYDSQNFTFGGRGDFVLTITDSFELQGRFTEITDQSSSKAKPTALNYLALRGEGPILEVHPAPSVSNKARGLDIRVAADRKFFTAQSGNRLEFVGYSIVQNGMSSALDNITILCSNNVGVNVAIKNYLLHLVVSLPPSMKMPDKGMGLMGNYDGHNGNDFISESNTKTSPGKRGRELYKNFALTWAVRPEDSLFPFHSNAEDLDRYTPVFQYKDIPVDDSDSPSESAIYSLCQDDMSCKWDYKFTRNRKIAFATLQGTSRINAMKSSSVRENNCGLPDVGRDAILNSQDFSWGNTVTVTGCPEHMSFAGEKTFKCVTETVDEAKENTRDDYGSRHKAEDAVEYITHWIPKPTPVCTEASDIDDAQLPMIIGIAVGGGALLIIIIIVVVVCIVKKRKSSSAERRDSVDAERRTDPASETMLSSKQRNPVYKPSEQTVRIGSSV